MRFSATNDVLTKKCNSLEKEERRLTPEAEPKFGSSTWQGDRHQNRRSVVIRKDLYLILHFAFGNKIYFWFNRISICAYVGLTLFWKNKNKTKQNNPPTPPQKKGGHKREKVENHCFEGFGVVLWHINSCRLFNTESPLYIYMICKHRSTQLNSSKYFYVYVTDSIKHQSFVYTQLNDETVLFLTIQFSINTQFTHTLDVSSIWSIDRTLSGATTPGQSEPGNNGNEGVLYIPQSSSLTIRLVIVITRVLVGGVESYPHPSRDAVRVFYCPSWMGSALKGPPLNVLLKIYLPQAVYVQVLHESHHDHVQGQYGPILTLWQRSHD